MVVGSGAQIGMLGNYAMLFDCDFLDAIERHIVANPTVVADYDLPRKGYVNAQVESEPCNQFLLRRGAKRTFARNKTPVA